MSSRQAAARVRRFFGGGRVGHGGSLDPLATGMLPVFLGDACRFAGYTLSSRKSYWTRICFGVRADTDDMDGRVVYGHALVRPTRSQLEQAAVQLCGQISQTPPRYSAVRVDGVRAWRLARSGQAPELKPRRVTVYRMEILAYAWPGAEIFMECSKGTYIRSIARDLGEKLGVGGVVEALRRTAVSGFERHDMHTLDELEKKRENGGLPGHCLLPADAGLSYLPVARLGDDELRRLCYGLEIYCREEFFPGQTCEFAESEQNLYRACDRRGRFYGLIRRSAQNILRSARLMPTEFFMANLDRRA